MLEIGVIGCGYWGPNLIRNFSTLDGVHVRAVADLNSKRLDMIRRQYPNITTLTTDSSQILGDTAIDAIVVATPVSSHFALGIEALSRGKHLFVEKPFTATSDQGRRLIDLAREKNLQIMVDHTFLYTGAVRTIKRFIDEGHLGQIYYFDSVRVNLGLFQHDVNVIWDLAPHDVSIMDHLLPGEPVAVAAAGMAHFESGIENIAYITTYYAGSLLGHIHVNWLAPVKVRRTLISGSERMIIYDDTEPSEKVKIYDSGVRFVRTKDEIYDMLIQYRTGDMLAPKVDLTEALKLVTQEFVDAVSQGRRPLTGGEEGLRVVRILEAANQSLGHSGQPIELRAL